MKSPTPQLFIGKPQHQTEAFWLFIFCQTLLEARFHQVSAGCCDNSHLFAERINFPLTLTMVA